MGEIGQSSNYQVKVDNWPLFFLQRLHHFYRKKSHCDLTLLFSTLDSVKSIKVHKLVLHACTDYFESLGVTKDSEHGEVLQLSNEMHPDVVIPIISFMYTGKLEFPVALQPRLYEAATKLRMTILTKLLDVQPNQAPSKTSSGADESITKVSISNETLQVPSNTESTREEPNISSVSAEVSQLPENFTSKPDENSVVTFIPSTPNTATTTAKKVLKPDITFIQRPDVVGAVKNNNQVKTKCIKKSIALQLPAGTPKSKVVDVILPPTLPGRKLPVWKRKVPFTGSQTIVENLQNSSSFRSVESPKPTRFEWEEEISDPTAIQPVGDALRILSHDKTTKIDHPIILDEDVEKSSKSNADDSLKRSSDGSSSESPPYKRSRQSDLQDMKEYGRQQQLRNEIICSEENSEDMMDSDDLYGNCDDEPDDLPNFSPTNVNTSTPKPILKSMSKPEPPMSSKRVRFSLEGKENNQQQQNEPVEDFTAVKEPESDAEKQKIVLPMDTSQITSGKLHVKIVSEILKKYPNLAKRDNIKLRVVSKNPAAVPPTVKQAVEGDAGAGNKSGSSLVSYIFLTNKSSVNFLPIQSDSTDKNVFDVENRTGPWICQVCDEMNPLEFESYYLYRRHLVEVHELKIDARICEYCGLKNSKRNHLLYHLYTKHGIEPPANVSFPKCYECDYIALSDALLLKHKNIHEPGITCNTCHVVFKTYSAMQMHLNSTWHRRKLLEKPVPTCPPAKVLPHYPCPFCDIQFENGNELKDHIETSHHSQEEKQIYRCPYCEDLFEDGDKLGKHIVSIHWGKSSSQMPIRRTETKVYKPQTGQQLQYQEEAEVSNDGESSEQQHSTELTTLSNVPSSVATSLSLVGNEQTVVYYEQRSEGQDIGGEATVVTGDDCKEYIISGPVEELDARHCQTATTGMESTINIENEDSNSRTSAAEEVHPTTCSDHDYSEPQVDENLRQVIPVQVANQITENSVIQQIIPDQRLVFSNQANVVFQSPCVNIPQRVLLAPGKVVLPQITHGDQNVILSQVIPQTQFILSSPILQQSGGIIEDGSNTIVFANPESTEQMESMHTDIQYSVSSESAENNEGQKSNQEVVVLEDEESQESEPKEDVPSEEQKNEPDDCVILDSAMECEESKESGEDKSTAEAEDAKMGTRVETSKIVDDWDETNESPQNVESRNDGPSRPEFF